jgi:hypothetical protein
MTGLYRVATNVDIYRTFLTWARPPQMDREPRLRPESRLRGATPTSLAICLRPMDPISGSMTVRFAAVSCPMPGTEVKRLTSSCQAGLALIRSDRAVSVFSSCRSRKRMWDRREALTTFDSVRRRRFFSATSISRICLRRSKISRSWRAALQRGAARGQTRPIRERPHDLSWPVLRWLWQNLAIVAG